MSFEMESNSKEELHYYNQELQSIRKQFEIYKMQLNHQRTRMNKIENFIGKWQVLAGCSGGPDSAGSEEKEPSPVRLQNICQIYEGEWQKKKQSPPNSRSPRHSPIRGHGKRYCEIHTGAENILDLYCLTDLVMICERCFIEDHYDKRCRVCSIAQLKNSE